MTKIMASVTVVLVIGYSYMDTHQVIPGSPGSGWDVAWRRFVLVTIGVTGALCVCVFRLLDFLSD